MATESNNMALVNVSINYKKYVLISLYFMQLCFTVTETQSTCITRFLASCKLMIVSLVFYVLE